MCISICIILPKPLAKTYSFSGIRWVYDYRKKHFYFCLFFCFHLDTLCSTWYYCTMYSWINWYPPSSDWMWTASTWPLQVSISWFHFTAVCWLCLSLPTSIAKKHPALTSLLSFVFLWAVPSDMEMNHISLVHYQPKIKYMGPGILLVIFLLFLLFVNMTVHQILRWCYPVKPIYQTYSLTRVN